MPALRSTIKVYDETARQYCDYLEGMLPQFNLTKFSSFLLKRRMDQIHKEVTQRSEGKKAKNIRQAILDAGCGGGRDVRYLIEEGFAVTGIDVSENIIKEAKRRVSKAKLAVMDLTTLEFKDECFDGVWCYGALGHIKKKDIPKTLAGFWRVLREQGILFITTLEGEGERRVERKELLGKKVHYSFFQQFELETALIQARFEIMSSTIEMPDERYVTIFCRKNQGTST